LGVAKKAERVSSISVRSKQSSTEFASAAKRAELRGVISRQGNSSALMRWVGSAGVPPAFLQCIESGKIAGGTPALPCPSQTSMLERIIPVSDAKG
jgi:hypothetical protein